MAVSFFSSLGSQMLLLCHTVLLMLCLCVSMLSVYLAVDNVSDRLCKIVIYICWFFFLFFFIVTGAWETHAGDINK